MSQDEKFDEQETQRRVEAALRGAMKPRTQMKDIPRKRPERQRKAGRETKELSRPEYSRRLESIAATQLLALAAFSAFG